MSSTEEGGGAVGAVSTDQTTINNNTNNDSVSIDMRCTDVPLSSGDVQLSSGELANLEKLDEAFEGGQPKFKSNLLIRKVPSTLRRNKDFKKYFWPKVISIGPLHHDDRTLQESKELKLKLAAHFVKNIKVDKDSLYSNMKKAIDDLKKCYDPQELEKYSDDDEKLAWMFFVDGCAILQAVYMRYGDDICKIYGQFIKNDLLTFVYSDLLLLENQIPFRVLELLTSSSDGEQFMNAIIRFIDDTVITPAEDRKRRKEEEEKMEGLRNSNSQGSKSKFPDFDPWESLKQGERIHLLHLLRVRLLFKKEKPRRWGFPCSNEQERRKEEGTKWCHSHTIHNVKELKKVGISLKASETSCLTDISFNRILFVGKLCLPPISVDDSTMNLIAYEMCPDFDNDFTVTSYMCFLDLLIDEAEDVKDLRDAGILYNRLGSDEEVAKLFNKMNTDLVPSPIYSGVKRKIHDHCKTTWIKHAAQGYHTYFRSPWTFLAFVGAITALLLGALQTYYAIHQQK
ncbi:hypothetical protein ES319_D11G360100v1 [Gossypium barbadense]|uniref:Uncharacterized protein n=1 Tax=Gossypium barbadense TaxID=3634 RepID=A0A5J5PIP1_GOSBA|nr:hypothetical protein ES319_D11G360100v1 [Gossypium barbadense]